MPFKHYHGRTGVVFNVSKRAIGVVVNKEVSFRHWFIFSLFGSETISLSTESIFSNLQVNGRVIKKRLHIATPHLRASDCQKQIIARRKENDEHKKNVREGKAQVIWGTFK